MLKFTGDLAAQEADARLKEALRIASKKMRARRALQNAIEVLRTLEMIESNLISHEEQVQRKRKEERNQVEAMKQTVFFNDAAAIQTQYEQLIGYTGSPTWFAASRSSIKPE